MATRTVTYTIKKPDGTAWANARVRFELTPGSYDATDNYPAMVVSGTTDENGEGSVDLWTNEAGEESSEYLVILPNGETDRFTVPEGAADVDLTALRLLGVVEGEAQYQTLVTFIENNPELVGPQGEQGVQGPQGDPGVTVSATEPASPSLNDIWIEVSA